MSSSNFRNAKEKLWSKVLIGDDCWEWTSIINSSGYGIFWMSDYFEQNGKKEYIRYRERAHRLVYQYWYGVTVKDLCVLHTCDNRKCVNPKHLFIGDRKDNSNDKVSKGRQAHGEMNGHISDEEVDKIRELKNSNKYTQRDIAKLLSVSEATVSIVVNNKHRMEPICQ